MNPIRYPLENLCEKNIPTVCCSIPSSTELLDTPLMNPQERLFSHLEEKKVIDSFGILDPKYQGAYPTYLHENQKLRLHQILNEPIEILIDDRGNTISFNLVEFFEFLNIDHIEIIGGTVYWILGKEGLEELARAIEIPKSLLDPSFFNEFETKAVDIDLRIFVSNDPIEYQEKISTFIHSKFDKNILNQERENIRLKFQEEPPELIEKRVDIELSKWIHKKVFKSRTDSLYQPQGEIWSQVSFASQTKYDLTFVKKLGRTHLFSHNDLKIIFELKNKRIEPKISSDHHFIESVMTLKLLKLIDAFNPSEINRKGAIMFLTYLSKGWTYKNRILETTLIPKILEPSRLKDFSKTIESHFPNDSFAPFIFAFNGCQLLIDNHFKETQLFLKECLKPFLNIDEEAKNKLHPFQGLLLELHEKEAQYDTFNSTFYLIKSFFQITSNFFLNVEQVSQTHLADKAYLKIQFKQQNPLSIFVKDSLIENLQLFEKLISGIPIKKKEKIEGHFRRFILRKITLLNSYDLNPKARYFIKNETLLKQFINNFLESHEPFLKELGFHLLTTLDPQENNSQKSSYILDVYFKFLKDKSLNKSRFHLSLQLFNYFEMFEKDLSVLNSPFVDRFLKAIQNEKITFEELTQTFCLEFSQSKNQELLNFVQKIWHENQHLFNPSCSFAMSHAMLRSFPSFSFKIFSYALEHSKKVTEQISNQFLQLLVSFKEPQNKAFFESSLTLIYTTAYDLISKQEISKQNKKSSDVKHYITLSKDFLENDYFMGLKFIKKLEEKKIVSRGLESLIKEPLNLSTKVLLFKELYQKGSSFENVNEHYHICHHLFFNSIEESHKQTVLDLLINFLKTASEHKSPLKNDLKKTLIMDVNLILIEHLKVHDDHLFENLLFVHKISKKIDFNLFKDRLLSHHFLTKMNQLLKQENNLSSFKFGLEIVKELQDLKDEDVYQKSTDFYLSLFQASFTFKEFEKSIDLLKTIHDRQYLMDSDQHERLVSETIRLTNRLIELQELELLEKVIPLIEKMLPTTTIETLWIDLLNAFDEKSYEKKSLLLVNKNEFLSKIPKIDLIVEQFISLTLQSNETLKKNQLENFRTLLELYKIDNEPLLKLFINKLKLLNDKLFTKQSLISLKNRLNNPTYFAFIDLLHEQKSDYFLDILDDIDSFFILLSSIEEPEIKKHFIYILKTNLLSLSNTKDLSKTKVLNTIDIIDETHPVSLNDDENKEIDLKFIHKFIDHPKAFEKAWSKMVPLAKNAFKAQEMSIMFETLLKGLEFLDLDEKSYEDQKEMVKTIFIHLFDSLNLTTVQVIVSIALRQKTLRSISLASKYLLKFIQTFDWITNQDPLIKSFKNNLNDFILKSIEIGYFKHIRNLSTPILLTSLEISMICEKFSEKIFKNPKTIHQKDKILFGLIVYQTAIQSEKAHSEVELENMKNAIYHLCELFFEYNDEKNYLIQLFKTIQSIMVHGDPIKQEEIKKIIYFDPYTFHLFFDEKIHEEVVKIPAKISIMNERLCQFLFILVEEMIKRMKTMDGKMNESTALLFDSIPHHLGYLNQLIQREKQLSVLSKKRIRLFNCITEFHLNSIRINRKAHSELVEELRIFMYLQKIDPSRKEDTYSNEESFLYIKLITLAKRLDLMKTALKPKEGLFVIDIFKNLIQTKKISSYLIAYDLIATYQDLISKISKECHQKVSAFYEYYSKKFREDFPDAPLDPALYIEHMLKAEVKK